LTCGACCAHFRVSFYWGESDLAQGGTVPPDLTEDLTPFRCCMKGTNQQHPRCAALQGEIGASVRCTIYEDRPSPCREFGVDWSADGLRFTPEELARCTQARAAWGLPSLFGFPAPNHSELYPPTADRPG
jgi:Fe-S-cluster containining protein